MANADNADTGQAELEALAARLDRIPSPTRRHVAVTTILVSMFVFDIIDLSSMAFVAPALRAEWGLSLEQLGLLTSTAFIGMFLGGLVGGRLADRFGRKPVMIVGVVVFSLASIASAFAPSAEVLAALRFILGFGVQMTTGAILVMVSEVFPKALRGRAMALVLGISLIGTPLIGLIALVLVPMGLWHGVFIAGGLGLIPALFALKFLPESPRWLAANGRVSEAEAQVSLYERQYVVKRGALPNVQRAASTAPSVKGSILDIFKAKLLGRTIVATLVFSGFMLINYGFIAWLPVILTERGYPQEQALTLSFILSFAYMAGALLSMLFIDRIERKFTIAIAITLAAAGFLTIGFVDSVGVLLVVGLITNMLTQVVLAAIYAYVPELFPIQVRGLGSGFAVGMGRVAGIFSGIILAAVLAAFAVEGVFVYLAALGIVVAAVVLFGPRTMVRRGTPQPPTEAADASIRAQDAGTKA